MKALEDQLTQTKHELLAAKAEVETTKEVCMIVAATDSNSHVADC